MWRGQGGWDLRGDRKLGEATGLSSTSKATVNTNHDIPWKYATHSALNDTRNPFADNTKDSLLTPGLVAFDFEQRDQWGMGPSELATVACVI
jgi:hypothetical protein